MSANAISRPADIFTREEIRALSQISDARAGWLIIHCWGTIFLTWLIVVTWTNPITVFLGIMIVGSRQLGLGVLSHDAAHYLLFRNRQFNDLAAEWLLNRPLLGASVLPYRNYHLVHHRFTQQENDPDLHLSAPFPVSATSMRRKLWRDLSGQTGWKQKSATIRQFFTDSNGNLDVAEGLIRLGPNILINIAFFSLFWWLEVGYLYVLLWIIPNLTWQMMVSRIRNISEHGAVSDDHDRLKNTRTTLAGPLERLLFAPYFVNYHLEHHLLVSCPCYRLPEMHKLLLDKGYSGQMEVCQSYPDMLSVAIRS